MTLSLLSLALVDDPLCRFWTLVAIGFVINTFAALQDVAVDGMAIDVLPENERGRANAFMAFGQVIGFSGFGALVATQISTVQTMYLIGGLLLAGGLGIRSIAHQTRLAGLGAHEPGRLGSPTEPMERV